MSGIASASLYENARFNALVVVPNALQGIFRRRRAPVAAATRANVDRRAVGLLAGMSRGHNGGPVWVRLVRERALLLLAPADVHRALAASPDPFASDPKAKRDGMCAFQPDALTISRGEAWRERRAFAESVLDTGMPQHRLAERFDQVARSEIEAILAQARGELRYDEWSLALRRITRRVLLGDSARDDEPLTDLLAELMSKANGMPGEPAERYPELLGRMQEYAAKAQEGSLVSLFAEAPDPHTDPAGQAIHWLFAGGDTIAANSFRALALLASHPRQRAVVLDELAGGGDHPYLDACLHEAMRLYPTTLMLARETLAETDWKGETVAAGTQVVIANQFMHRDTARYPWADAFSPERWIDGEAAEAWSFNHFSRGPQGCPGVGLAMLIGKRALASVLSTRAVELRSGSLDPERPLPHMLDFFGLRFGLSSR
ncbi:MAG: cytochrome P450 [Solirubrobacterales bacterium]